MKCPTCNHELQPLARSALRQALDVRPGSLIDTMLIEVVDTKHGVHMSTMCDVTRALPQSLRNAALRLNIKLRPHGWYIQYSASYRFTLLPIDAHDPMSRTSRAKRFAHRNKAP